jgi:hypothetical protein
MRWDVKITARKLLVGPLMALPLIITGCGGSGGSTDSASAPVTSVTISGTPASSVAADSAYTFVPTVNGASGALSFSATNIPAWASFDITTGRLSGTPGTGNIGSFANISISVSDRSSSATLPAFSIQVTGSTQSGNTAPVISGAPTTSISAGTAYSFMPTASDADHNTLTFAIANKPSWAIFSNTTGQLSGSPSAANAGTYANIQISVSDGTASASLPGFSITVTQATQGSVALTWTTPTQNTDGSSLTGLVGYHIHYGSNPGSLTQTVDVANAAATGATVQGLSTGTYYFTLSTYTATDESAQTNPVSAAVL